MSVSDNGTSLGDIRMERIHVLSSINAETYNDAHREYALLFFYFLIYKKNDSSTLVFNVIQEIYGAVSATQKKQFPLFVHLRPLKSKVEKKKKKRTYSLMNGVFTTSLCVCQRNR